MANPAKSEDTRMEFFRSATQYYIAGRFSAIAQLFPFCGNLLHHAVEMYLKGALSAHLTLDELRTFSHDLNEVWTKFKTVFPDPHYAQFDAAVSTLHRFERLRYPDTVLREGMQGQFALLRAHFVVHPQTNGRPMPPTYNLVLEDVDHLVKVIFDTAKVNPSSYILGNNDQAKHFLSLHNAHPLLPAA
jgi:hypothetical protein